MITAKDIFNLEQEMAAELASQIYEAGFSSEERNQIFAEFGEMTEERYNELLKIISDRQISPLARVRNGELLLISDVIKAVKQAVNNPNT
jgi:acyl-CoA reductase-like NAD-dependent aldehyde dehydrogenase